VNVNIDRYFQQKIFFEQKFKTIFVDKNTTDINFKKALAEIKQTPPYDLTKNFGSYEKEDDYHDYYERRQN
jgi:hypothetical protein